MLCSGVNGAPLPLNLKFPPKVKGSGWNTDRVATRLLEHNYYFGEYIATGAERDIWSGHRQTNQRQTNPNLIYIL